MYVILFNSSAVTMSSELSMNIFILGLITFVKSSEFADVWSVTYFLDNQRLFLQQETAETQIRNLRRFKSATDLLLSVNKNEKTKA